MAKPVILAVDGEPDVLAAIEHDDPYRIAALSDGSELTSYAVFVTEGTHPSRNPIRDLR